MFFYKDYKNRQAPLVAWGLVIKNRARVAQLAVYKATMLHYFMEDA